MPETIRTFVAINLGGDVRTRLGELMENLRPELPTFRWAKAEQLHLTLAFLGDIDAGRVSELSTEIADAVRSMPFEIEWKGLGAFPRASHGSILWVGADRGSSELTALQRALSESLASAGFPPDSRFTPHVTLARMKRHGGRSADLRALIDRHRDESFGVDRVTEVVLMRSDFKPGGSNYTSLAVFPLGGL
jgi:RNA 2',3'-cyclic 3'-phosphodiesterase